MKTLFIQSHLKLQSEHGKVEIVTETDTIHVAVSSWSVFSSLLGTLKGQLSPSPQKAWHSTRQIAQSVRLSVKGKQVITVRQGKLRSFRLLPLLRAAFLYLRKT